MLTTLGAVRFQKVAVRQFRFAFARAEREVGVGLLDRDIASQLQTAFYEDLRRGDELTLEQWLERCWYERAVDWVAYQMHDQW